MIYVKSDAADSTSAAVLYRNIMTEGVLSATNETADGSAANALGPQTYDFWTPSSLPSSIYTTLTAPVECDACAIVAHTIGSSGCSVALQQYNGSAWVNVQTVTPEDDADILMIFGPVSSDQWRIRLTGPAVASIGVIMLGPRLIIPHGVLSGYVPINLALTVDLMRNTTRGGQFMGNRTQKIGAATTIQLHPQDRAWIETDARGFIAHFNTGQPFIWAGCPDLLPSDMAYCWRSGAVLSASMSAGSIYGEMSMEVGGYVPQ